MPPARLGPGDASEAQLARSRPTVLLTRRAIPAAPCVGIGTDSQPSPKPSAPAPLANSVAEFERARPERDWLRETAVGLGALQGEIALAVARAAEARRRKNEAPNDSNVLSTSEANASTHPTLVAPLSEVLASEGGPSEVVSKAEPGLFRSAAVEARRAAGPEVDFKTGLEPKSWGMLVLLVSLIGLSFGVAAIANVEVTAEAQGTLRAPRGLRPVASVLSGSVAELLVESGDAVEAGQVVARLEATELRAALVNRERELETTRGDVSDASRRDREMEERAALAMQRRRAALQGRIEINGQRLAARRQQSDNYEILAREGSASQTESLNMKESLQQAAESVSALSAEVALLDLELADRARQWQERESTRKAQLSRAEANAEEARSLLASTEIHAPAAGQIESLLVSPGSVVEAGGLLGNVVPRGAPRIIVAFVPSREIAFVTPGSAATVEVQSLSISEFGLAQARVTRVSSDVATPAEVQAALGEPLSGSVVRVELELTESEASARMDGHLRSGERVTTRLHRRQRRVLTLLFDFVRKWLA